MSNRGRRNLTHSIFTQHSDKGFSWGTAGILSRAKKKKEERLELVDGRSEGEAQRTIRLRLSLSVTGGGGGGGGERWGMKKTS